MSTDCPDMREGNFGDRGIERLDQGY